MQEDVTPGVRPQRSALLARRTALPVGGCLVALVVLGITTPGFYATGNLLNLGQVAAILGVVTVGQMIVMVGGGLDLSVGATAGLAFFAIAEVSRGSNGGILQALAVTFGLALAIGVVNAFLVVGRNIPPFVATLGTLIVIKGVVSAWSHGAFQGSVPPGLRGITTVHVGPVSMAVVVLLAVILLSGALLGRSVFGPRLYATGLNDRAAAYAGVPVARVRAVTYVISALLAALAGLLLGAYTGFVDPTAGQSLNLESVAAAVVGGVSLLGGRGRTLNAFAGVVLMTLVLNVGLLHGLSGQSQSIMTGLVLLLAAFLYGVRGRQRA